MTDDEIKEACRLASEVLSVEDRFSPGFIATDARFLASALLAVVAQRDSALEDAEFFRHAHNASEDKRSRTGIEAEQRGYQRALDEVANGDGPGAQAIHERDVAEIRAEERARVLDEVAGWHEAQAGAWDAAATDDTVPKAARIRSDGRRRAHEDSAAAIRAGRVTPTRRTHGDV